MKGNRIRACKCPQCVSERQDGGKERFIMKGNARARGSVTDTFGQTVGEGLFSSNSEETREK